MVVNTMDRKTIQKIVCILHLLQLLHHRVIFRLMKPVLLDEIHSQATTAMHVDQSE